MHRIYVLTGLKFKKNISFELLEYPSVGHCVVIGSMVIFAKSPVRVQAPSVVPHFDEIWVHGKNLR
jgi:hypothetical protein